MCWGVYGLSRPAHPPSRWGLWITSCFSLSLTLVFACLFVFESYCCFHTVYRLHLLLVSDLNASEFLRQFASPRSTRFSPSGSSSTWTPFAITCVAPRKELLRCPCEWHCGTCGHTERKSSSCLPGSRAVQPAQAAPSGGGTREAQPQLRPSVSCSSLRAAGEQLGAFPAVRHRRAVL